MTQRETQQSCNVTAKLRIVNTMRIASVAFLLCSTVWCAQPYPTPVEGDHIIRNFKFASGETLPELRLHYTAIGTPSRNAILIMHGTGGSGNGFLSPTFAGELFGSGQLLDATRHYIILCDAIGHGKSSKPSDGLHAHFPQYDYDDMVAAQHEMLVNGLGVNHLRLILGTSMGCMHSYVWGETYPDFMDALMPLACLPVPVAGRNRMWRKAVMDAIRNDPQWLDGDYVTQPRAARDVANLVSMIVGSAPIQMLKSAPTRDTADAYLAQDLARRSEGFDANDEWYALNASRNYNPTPLLEAIRVPMMHINSADDFINPPELAIAQREIKRVKQGKFVLIAASEESYGHGTHTRAVVWKQYLKEVLDASKP